MKIKVKDLVRVMAGKDKGKEGKVLKILVKKDRVVVDGVNIRTKHVKKTPQRAGQKIEYPAAIHISNVMAIDPKTKKPTRIGYKVEKGKKNAYSEKIRNSDRNRKS